MDRVAQYRQAIQSLILKHKDSEAQLFEVKQETIFDTEHDHYQLVNVGWQNDRRIYGCVLHLDIENGKVWIQHNGTEHNIADELVELGVPKNDIVLGFQSPFKRQFSGFATK